MSPNQDVWSEFKPDRRSRKVADKSDLINSIIPFAFLGAMAFLVGGWALDMYVGSRRASARYNRFASPEQRARRLYEPPPTHVHWAIRTPIGGVVGAIAAVVTWSIVRKRQLEEIEEKKRQKRAKKQDNKFPFPPGGPGSQAPPSGAPPGQQSKAPPPQVKEGDSDPFG